MYGHRRRPRTWLPRVEVVPGRVYGTGRRRGGSGDHRAGCRTHGDHAGRGRMGDPCHGEREHGQRGARPCHRTRSGSFRIAGVRDGRQRSSPWSRRHPGAVAPSRARARAGSAAGLPRARGHLARTAGAAPGNRPAAPTPRATHPLEIRYDEFTVDIPENRILRAAVERMLRLPRVHAHSRRRLQRLRAQLIDVSSITRGELLPAWLPSRLTPATTPRSGWPRSSGTAPRSSRTRGRSL